MWIFGAEAEKQEEKKQLNAEKPTMEDIFAEIREKAKAMQEKRNLGVMNKLDCPRKRHMLPMEECGQQSLGMIVHCVQRSPHFLRIRKRHFPEEFPVPERGIVAIFLHFLGYRSEDEWAV